MSISPIRSTVLNHEYVGAKFSPEDISRYDLDTMDKIDGILKRYDSYISKNAEIDDEIQSKKKSMLGVAASVVIGTLGVFFVAKKGIKGINSFAGSIKNKLTGKKSVEQASDFFKSTKPYKDVKKISDDVFKKINNNEKLVGLNNFVLDNLGGANKEKSVAAINALSGATALGVSAKVAMDDRNGDGISDVAQNGIKAYKEGVKHLGFIEEMVNLVS